MQYLDLMEKEILTAKRALSIGEALEMAKEDGTFDQLDSVGKTPQKTINSLLHKDIVKGDKARFIQVGSRPATFDLKK